MGKLDDMLRGAGANVSESMGANRQGAPAPGTTQAPFGGVPARLQGVVKARDAAEIPVEKIQPDPSQPREEFEPEALERLAQSLKTRGQLQPIRVRWDEAKAGYLIIAGERRWRAALRAGMKSMACVIHEGAVGAGDLLAMQLVENMLREDLRPIEEAKAFRSLMDHHGWSARQLARELAIDHTGVTRSLALLELPEPVRASVEEGALPPATAYELSKIEDPALQEEVAHRVVAEGLSRAETVEVLHRATGRSPRTVAKTKTAKPGKPSERVFRSKNGLKITIEFKKGLTSSLMRAAMLEAIGELDAEFLGKHGIH